MAFYLKFIVLPTNVKCAILNKYTSIEYQHLFCLSQKSPLILYLSDKNGILYGPSEKELGWLCSI